MREALIGKVVGVSVKRIEDPRLLAGRGRYIDDVTVAGIAHAAFLRSPWPHAMIRSIDITAARTLPGVVGVLTGTDMQALTYPFFGVMTLPGLYGPPYWSLATDRVRMVGDPLAMVVAESRRLAEDACELIEVDYEPLEPIASIADALNPAKPPLWPRAKSNVMYRATDTYGDVNAAFAGADRIIRERFEQHRHANQPMETRGGLAEIDTATRQLTYHSATQAVVLLKWCLALLLERQSIGQSLKQIFPQHHRMNRLLTASREYLKRNPQLLAGTKKSIPTMARLFARDPKRSAYLLSAVAGLLAKDPCDYPEVQAGDIGGAFGSKFTVGGEDVAVCAAALLLGRSVKWIEDRNENLMIGGHAREETLDIEAAVREDGTVLGLRVGMTLDSGAYQSFPIGADLVCRLINTMFPGPYRIGALRFDTTMVATNKGPYVFYRGPWAAETWVRERMLDVIAKELGLSRGEIRMRNMHGPEHLPSRMVTGPKLDVRMSARTTLERALEIAEFDHWDDTKAEALKGGRCLGLGLATFIEAAPGPPGYMDLVSEGFHAIATVEPIHAVLETDGGVTIITQQQPHGQGHETTLAQVAADELGVPMESVRVRYGNSRIIPFGFGTGGSKSAAMAGGATILAASVLRERIIDIAADLLEAAPSDVIITGDRVHVRGTPAMAVTLADVAAAAIHREGDTSAQTDGPTEAIRVTRAWNGGEGGWSQATHVCWVDVDLDTGQVRIPRYAVVEDCGDIINPAIVDGQIRGGVAQGIGAVLYEKSTYDETGQFQTGTFMDYLLPTAMEIPEIEIHHLKTPSDIAANFRGVGEGGMIGTPAALTNAIEDALSPFGVRIREQHLPPSRILELAKIIPTAG